MQSQTGLMAATSYLWQPAELARRVLGERPSSVPPTREMWPTSGPLAISTVHLAYLRDDDRDPPRRPRPLPPPPGPPPPPPRLCTVGTNTDPPPAPLDRIKTLFRRAPRHESRDVVSGRHPADRQDAPRARRAIDGIRKALNGTKHRIGAADSLDSPKIVYEQPKPGDRMGEAFGAPRGRWSCPALPTLKLRCRPSLGRWSAGGCFGGGYRARSRTEAAASTGAPPVLRLQMTQV